MVLTTTARSATWPQFVAWALCGASAALVLLAAFAAGPLAVVPAAGFAVLAVKLGGANASAVGSAAGVGLWGVALGWPWRDDAAPWPVFLAGATVVIAAAAGFAMVRRRSARAA
jgi:hypothetical protein